MSYDLRLAVKVEGGGDLYAVIAQPEYRNPTYNLGEMFRACTGWDYTQGDYYKVADVLPLINKGIEELENHPTQYRRYEPPNGWGSVEGALKALKSLKQCIEDTVEGGWSWNKIPPDMLYVAW